MRTPTHRRFGVAVALAAGTATGAGLAHTAAMAATAAVLAGGILSPDCDNSRAAHALDRWLPDEVLGHGGPLQHRGLMHWWGLPAGAAGWLYALGAPGWLQPLLWGAVLAWGSHLAGDLVFGRANARVGLRRGIPVMPWWRHVGVGLKADGWVERVVSWALVPAVAGLAVMAVAGTP